MVAIAQLAEHLVVAQKVVGSSPTGHPSRSNARLPYGGRAFVINQTLAAGASDVLSCEGIRPCIACLVLNATYEPLSIVSVQRAIVLLLKEKAELIEAAEERLHAARTSLPVPLVIRLVYYVRIPHPGDDGTHPRSVACCATITPASTAARRRAARCLTLDHMLPRSRGGQTTWENVVTACRTCNMRKGDRTPEEAGMVLRKRPGRPHYLAFLLLARGGTARSGASTCIVRPDA